VSARLAPHFQPPALASEAGAAMARQTFALLAQGGYEDLLAADAGWLPLTARLVPEPKVRAEVKALLSKMDKAAVEKALEATKPKETAKPVEAAAPVAPRAPADWLARDRAGAHVEVWNELRALGTTAGELGIREEVQAVAEETMGRVRRNIERVVRRLSEKGYQLEARKKALGQPAPKSAIEAIERQAGGPMPASLRAFYAIVGSIDLREGGGAYREGEQLFETLGAQDPLIVLGARDLRWGGFPGLARTSSTTALREPPQRRSRRSPGCPLRCARCHIAPDTQRPSTRSAWASTRPWRVRVGATSGTRCWNTESGVTAMATIIFTHSQLTPRHSRSRVVRRVPRSRSR
jgi:hypothetical protein